MAWAAEFDAGSCAGGGCGKQSSGKTGDTDSTSFVAKAARRLRQFSAPVLRQPLTARQERDAPFGNRVQQDKHCKGTPDWVIEGVRSDEVPEHWHPILHNAAQSTKSMPDMGYGTLDDFLSRDLDNIPLEEEDLIVLNTWPGLQAHTTVVSEVCDPSVCSDSTCDASRQREALDEPPKMPKLPFASRLAEENTFQQYNFQTFTPRCGGGNGNAPIEWRPQTARLTRDPKRVFKPLPPFSLQDLERTIQKVDYSRLEARLFEDECNPSRDKDPDATTCNSEEQQLIDSPRRGDICGGGCRLIKLSSECHRDPDDDVVGGLHEFLSGADDDALSYILDPAGKPHFGWPTAL